jgi:WD40 repeat protein
MYRKSSRFNLALILGALILVMVLLGSCVTSTAPPTPTPISAPSEKIYMCFVEFKVEAWSDVDGDNQLGLGESPLQGVQVYFKHRSYIEMMTTNSTGVAAKSDFYDCPNPCSLCPESESYSDVTVSADAPVNYRQTSQVCDSKGCLLGFVPISDTVAPPGTPRIPIPTVSPAERSKIFVGDIALSIAFSPDGKSLAYGTRDSRKVILWDVNTRKSVDLPIARRFGMGSVVFSPDGMMLASTSYDAIILWDMSKSQPIGQPLIGNNGWSECAGFSPDGKLLALARDDNTIVFLDVSTRQTIGQPLSGHNNRVSSVAFSPDGKILASGSVDDTIILWDVSTHQPIGQPLKGHQYSVYQYPVYSVAFSPDGKTLASASADKPIILWDMSTRQPIGQPLLGHTGAVYSVAFSPDGRILASASADKTIILWDMSTHQPIGQPLLGHIDTVKSVAFSPDGKVLASSSFDKTIIFWDVSNPRSPAQILWNVSTPTAPSSTPTPKP